MKWITEYFIREELKKTPKKQYKNSLQTVGRINTISLIAPSLIEINETEAILKAEFGQKLQVTGLFYGEGTTAKEAFSYKDFSLFGKPKEKINKFLTYKSDVIIASSEKLNIFSLYLLYLSQQSYSIGYYEESHKPFLDLMLTKEDRNPQENMEHLIKYLKQVILK
jgi:hypothetical protein